MHDVIEMLLEQSATKFELLGFDERPVPRPPVEQAQLKALEEWWEQTRHEPIAPSYREFLLVCDGIENFSASYSLLGAQDLLSPEYTELLEKVLSQEISFDYDPDLPPLMVGYDPETSTRVFLEFRHERQAPPEPMVLDGDPGDMSLHPSFGDFLELSIDANLRTIAELLEVRRQAEE